MEFTIKEKNFLKRCVVLMEAEFKFANREYILKEKRPKWYLEKINLISSVKGKLKK